MTHLIDQHERELIKTALDQNMLVEAAAGTGKTTELVHRIVNVFAEGRARADQIVAVTFTDKAAGELKLRLRSELEQERKAAESDPARLKNLEAVIAHLEEAHVSTIHGFCADLLRARPVEAGVDPEFKPMPEAEAERLYDESFTLWLQEKLENPPEGIRRALRRKASEPPVDRLRTAGWTLAEWRDFKAPWRRDPSFARQSEIDKLVASVQEFSDRSAHPTHPRDLLYSDTREAHRISFDVRVLEQVRDRRDYDGLEAEFVKLAFDRNFKKPRKGSGREYAKGIAREEVLAAHRALASALEDFAHRANADLAALLQQELLGSLDRYEQAKVRAGRLDFLDLLVRARGLIRDCPGVRAEFQQRFTHIFIDEFQDTDPLQVEILLLLASADPATRDWRETTLTPGKIFMVGDPKQGIYRFRRADVGIYQEVKKVLVDGGATRLRLSTSFRAVPSIQRAINAAFAPLMTGDAATAQPEYVALAPDREEHLGQPSIIALPIPRPYGRQNLTATAIEKSLPDAVGAFVDWLLRESQWTVTERERPNERVPISPRHVCLLFRRFDSGGEDVTRGYVDALEARDIPHLLIGGKSFHNREEVETVRSALAAIEWPDDELSVFATLKGALFAVSDDALLEYRHLYQRLYVFGIPKESPPARLAPIVEALEIVRELHRNRNYRPVAETLTRLLEATRGYAGFALRPSGEQALANVLHIAELAREYDASGGISFRGFVERLREEAESGSTPEAPILEEGSEGVRIMTVHKAKGLEFPVVILADITAKLARSRASRYLDRERGLCAVELAGWSPAELVEHNDEEAARDGAEGVRVAYVAASRARDLLVVPAVGDDPLGLKWEAANDWWVSPLHQAIYPAPGRRRHPEPGPVAACPAFGEDTVLERPDGASARVPNVRPGLHTFPSRAKSEVLRLETSEAAEASSYGVVWWDPSRLQLDQPPRFGIRRHELLLEGDRATVERDLAAFHAWEAERKMTLEAGARPSLVVRTITERAAAAADVVPQEASDVTLIEIARDVERPAGPCYGALVHAVLATIALDTSASEVRATANLHGRILGATELEVESAAGVVEALLRHPIVERAREAARRDDCRRETPVTMRESDGTLVEGIVDLAFREGDTWTVVDFKTDRELEKRVETYRRQVSLYASAIALATGQKAQSILMRV